MYHPYPTFWRKENLFLLKLWRDFWRDPWQARYTVPLVIINALGSGCGYYWYHEQLAATPFYDWLFVPDSPLASTLVTLALLMRGNSALKRLFQAIAFTAAIKYGIWAMVIITQYWLIGGPPGFTEVVLWFSHMGMAVEGVIFLKTLRLDRISVSITGLWMLLNDFMDYHVGLHPYLFAPEQELLAAFTAPALSFLLTGSLVLLQRITAAGRSP